MFVEGSSAASGAVLALLAAVSWGGGDFAGGMGAKVAGGTPQGALRLLIAAHGISLSALLLLLLPTGSMVWHGGPVVWGVLCGMVAGCALAAFYVALARGAMGSSAALSGLLAAAIPAAVGIALEGRPTAMRCVGFALAAVAIPLIAAPPGGQAAPVARGTTWLAIAGGVGFGLYFAGLKFANSLGVLEPLALARVGSLISCSFLLLVMPQAKGASARRKSALGRVGWLWALATAVLDSGGNLLYIAATRAGRLDVAAVLASLYPASTILLAAAMLHERPGRWQKVGMGVALVAVVLVTL